MPNQTITVQYIGAELSAEQSIEHAAKNARMYRIAARDLRKCGNTAGARRMEAQARAAERAIVRAADAILNDAAWLERMALNRLQCSPIGH